VNVNVKSKQGACRVHLDQQDLKDHLAKML